MNPLGESTLFSTSSISLKAPNANITLSKHPGNEGNWGLEALIQHYLVLVEVQIGTVWGAGDADLDANVCKPLRNDMQMCMLLCGKESYVCRVLVWQALLSGGSMPAGDLAALHGNGWELAATRHPGASANHLGICVVFCSSVKLLPPTRAEKLTGSCEDRSLPEEVLGCYRAGDPWVPGTQLWGNRI